MHFLDFFSFLNLLLYLNITSTSDQHEALHYNDTAATHFLFLFREPDVDKYLISGGGGGKSSVIGWTSS